MDYLLASAITVGAGAITPGPNNLIVLRAAAEAGVRAAVPAIAAIALGSMALLGVALLGTAVLDTALPQLRQALALLGCAYLVWMGTGLVVRTFGRRPVDAGAVRAQARPKRLHGVGLFSFQFMNPKAWAMTLAVATAAQDATACAQLALLFAVIPTLCLALWAWSGAHLAPLLQRPRVAAAFDRVMGAALIAAALVLLRGE